MFNPSKPAYIRNVDPCPNGQRGASERVVQSVRAAKLDRSTARRLVHVASTGHSPSAAQDSGTLETPAHGLSLLWPIGLIAAVLYGSLLPFDVDWTAFRRAGGFGLPSLRLQGANLEDIVTNVLVYIPLGLALVLGGRRRATTRPVRLCLAVVVGAAVSLLAETLQTGIVMRVPSWIDVALNALGTAIGALLGAAFYGLFVAALGRLRRKLTEHPFATLSSILTIGLLLYCLAPFDFITDTAGLHASFIRTGRELLPSRATAVGGLSTTLMVAKLSGAVWFAVLGYLLALAARESGRSPVHALGSAIKHGFILAGLIELMQLFTASHQCELAAVAVRTFAVMSGAGCAAFLLDHIPDWRWKQRPELVLPTMVLAALIIFQVFAVFASSVQPDPWLLHRIDLSQVRWVPFETLWGQSLAGAASEALTSLVTYGTLTLTLILILRRTRFAAVPLIAGIVVTSFALSVEALKACTVSAAPDLTGPVLAVIAAAAALRLCAALQPGSLASATPSPARAAV